MSATDQSQFQKKKNNRKWLAILLVVVVIGGAVFLNQQRLRKANERALAALDTTPYARETLISTISGAGTIRPRQSAVLFWQTSGFVGASSVSVGDTVTENTVLYQLDESRLPADILQARLNLLNAQSSLKNLEADTNLQRATLQNNISSAQNSLTTLNQNLLALTERVCSEWRLSNLQSAYDDALKNYQDYPSPARWMQVQNARAELDYCDPAVIARDITSLNAQINLQQQNIDGWEAELQKIADGPDPEVKEKLELQLSLAKKQLDNQTIKAPFSGTITSLSYHNGDVVSMGKEAAQIADLSALFVDVPISEIDIPQIKVGQKVDLVFDAFFDQTFSGTVSEVDTVGTNVAGIVNYNVTIQLESQSEGIKPGMTVGVTIIIEEKPNTYTVPTESIANRNGNYYVYVLRNGKPVEVQVKLGAYSSRKVEILSGDIKDGELVLLSPPSNLMEYYMRMGRPR